MPILILIPIPATSHQAFPMFEKLAMVWHAAEEQPATTPVTLRPASSPAGAVWGRGRDTSSAKPTLRVTRGEEIRNLWEHVTMGDLEHGSQEHSQRLGVKRSGSSVSQ
ncbi:hypothetical protein E5D57_008394 [Metarhizium anisopliae]|nr:hypothetical protein E5D57_008394 [Metarhizium anisopliae]